ncbi:MULTISPECIES: MFS transporter [Paraburkholderia]|uniref:MFS transporter n=1 Tax=Paraburkholderia youngii TaxID=2782701 RepID=A0ABX2NX74_9BURK|nr:MFS transporter [Paraburkholderia youngii]NVI09112.1 MFS transporter [Paraburkholderia youngii]
MSAPAELPSALKATAFIPFLVASAALAAAYGASFLLADYLRASGLDVSMAGTVISSGIFTMIISSLFAGWIAQRIGLMSTIIAAAGAMSAAMLAFGLTRVDLRIAFAGGLLLGLGWSAFNILAPLQIIHHLKPSARIRYLTLLSGAQMAGLGFASPTGHFLAHRFGSFYVVYIGLACVCLSAAVALAIVRKLMQGTPHLSMAAVGITPSLAASVLCSTTRMPIAMIGLAACAFAGLSTYQTAYAESRHLPAELFFLTFTLTTVVCRFTLAPAISRLPVRKLAFALFIATLAALALFICNRSSSIVYVISACVFAIGYGLTYSTLNSMAVNLAGDAELSVPVTSQVFTIAYFAGVFGFPYIAGMLVAHGGINLMLTVTLAIASVNVLLLARTHSGSPRPAVTAHY